MAAFLVDGRPSAGPRKVIIMEEASVLSSEKGVQPFCRARHRHAQVIRNLRSSAHRLGWNTSRFSADRRCGATFMLDRAAKGPPEIHP